MIRKIFRFCLILSILLLLPVKILAEEKHEHHNKHHSEKEVKLPEGLKNALTKEMKAIQGGMIDIIMAMAAANWDEIVKNGKMIEESYIIKQELTKEERRKLHHAFPHGFHELDFVFHKTAGRLAHAAEKHDTQSVAFYFYKLTESCMTCHSKYAKKVFPGFGSKGMEHDHKK